MKDGITNMSHIDKKLAEIERDILRIASELKDGKEYQRALHKASKILVEAMQRRAPEASETLYRYKNGRRVASYEPGNLKRSIKQLDHFKSKSAKWVGPEIMPRGKGRGNFGGSKVDGWYARFVEKRRPFIRPAAIESGPQAINEMNQFVKQVIIRAKRGGS